MIVEFYGVRGSAPTPGQQTVKYGGNTPCTYIESSKGDTLVLDSGTGIVGLGQRLIKEEKDIYILLTHNHWDHIQGFPFFAPIYQFNRNIHIYVPPTDPPLYEAILKQMAHPFFPVPHDELHANVKIHGLVDHEPTMKLCNFSIATKRLNHPNGGYAYRIENKEGSIGYIVDNELDPPYEKATTWEEWVDFLQGVDIMIHDAQYTQDEMPHKHGWGHSLIEDVVQLAKEAKVGTLILFSHDPARSDEQVDELVRNLRKRTYDFRIIAAREGMCLSQP